VLIGVALVSGCALALQVLLTRLLSAIVFYHFGFLVISLGLLGVGGGAMLIYVRPGWFVRGSVERALATWSTVLAALLIVVPAVLVRLDYAAGAHLTRDFAVTLATVCALAALPFLAAGIVVALAIRHYIAAVGRVYAFDLAGAGLGAVAMVPLLWALDAPTLIVGLGAAAGLAAVLFAGPAHSARAVGAAAVAVGLVLAGVSSVSHLYYLPSHWLFTQKPVADRWTPISRVVAYGPLDRAGDTEVTYDRDAAPVPGHRRGTPYPDWGRLQLGPQSIGYAVTAPGRVLVIGGGGGRDIYNALASGKRRVDVIELNRGIRDVVDHELGRWSGSPYTLPGVHTTVGDGRATLEQRGTRYDEINIGFTNTLSGNAGSSFALTENNLYTVEAVNEYLDHLRSGGVLAISRLYRLSGEEALRATVLVLQALRDRGIRDPRRHVVVVLGYTQGQFFGTVLARLEPWTAPELATIRRLAAQRTSGVALAPGGPYQLEWRQLAAAGSLHGFCTAYRIDVCAPTDDKPFFLNVTRLRDVGFSPLGYTFSPSPFLVLLVALGILLVLALLAFAVPLVAVSAQGRPPWSSLLFFAAIGLGFLIFEIVSIQRFVLFLGFPTYSLSVVLFSLLVFTGLGALLSGGWADPRRALSAALVAAIALIAASAVGLQPMLHALIDIPFPARIAITVLLLAPLGLVLGMAMPIGLARLSTLYPTGVPWAWGINGVTSVLASVLGVAVAITFGFEVATFVAAASYLAALVHVRVGWWPGADSGAASRPSRRANELPRRPDAEARVT
jgi:hypothetical protein